MENFISVSSAGVPKGNGGSDVNKNVTISNIPCFDPLFILAQIMRYQVKLRIKQNLIV